jgi:hypothetical protein
VHQLFPSSTGINDGEGNVLVTSYAVHRPDGQWAVMLVNRDEKSPHTVRVVFDHSKNQRKASFSGPVTLVTFGSEQYVWKNDAENSHADPDGPPVSTVVPETRDRTFVLPKASITVLRGEVEGLMR